MNFTHTHTKGNDSSETRLVRGFERDSPSTAEKSLRSWIELVLRPTSYLVPRTSYFRFPTNYVRLPTSYLLLATSYFRLPTSQALAQDATSAAHARLAALGAPYAHALDACEGSASGGPTTPTAWLTPRSKADHQRLAPLTPLIRHNS